MLYKDIDLMLENIAWFEKLNKAKDLYINRRNSAEDLNKYRKIRNYIRGVKDYKLGIKGKYPYKN